ncbi:hypothetical protein [Chryseolinea lacunae]|uniref:G-D-S-L family lipolytic protein n=1 Tax=Chryseolinea lacunae TaxID=2801331 RepID=A0ABS1KXD2_9BACT|nr:hypothetical protein [Chryseolinea lacunae]MBL0743863.1 hypothetical protein [Chryseolinea lacunae]
MRNLTKYFALAAGMTLAGACTYDFPEAEEPTQGEANFTKTVVVGSSLSAGFMNGALYDAGQKNSFVTILATQMKAVGGGNFNQPDINATDGYYGVATGIPGVPDGTILGRLYLKGTTSPSPTPKIPGQAIGPFAGDKAALNNFSAYGVSIQTSLAPQLGGPASANPYFNPYYARFASNPGTSTLIGDAAAALANGSFLVFWLGNDDVLGYATNGADQNDPTKPITSVPAFTGAYNAAFNALLAANANAKGVVANIPDVTALPYFSTVNPLAISVPAASRPALQAGLGQLNAAINGWNAGVDANGGLTPDQKAALKRPVLSTAFDKYPIVILDVTLSDAQVPDGNGGTFTIPKIRNAKADDKLLLTLTAASQLLPTGAGIDPTKPVNEAQHDKYYLTAAEQTEIQARITDFNAVISAAVTSHADRFVLVDVNKLLLSLKTNGASIGGSALSATISPPFGGFSLDGIHPNARGNGYIANAFIETINSKFKSDIPLCNPNNFAGNELPVP